MQAWDTTWDFLCEAFSAMVADENCGLIGALMNGTPRRLRQMLVQLPKMHRVSHALRVTILGLPILPVEWAVKEGHTAKLNVLLTDLLSIKADRSGYFCGRVALYKEHPNIVELLVGTASAREVKEEVQG